MNAHDFPVFVIDFPMNNASIRKMCRDNLEIIQTVTIYIISYMSVNNINRH